MTPPSVERRSAAPQTNASPYNPVVARLEQEAIELLREHDQYWASVNSVIWQVEYRLLNHCEKLARMMERLGVEQGLDREALALRHSAGLLHDIGKANPACVYYRLRLSFTPEQRAELSRDHSDLSGKYVVERLAEVRPEDHEFIRTLYVPVRFHHRPHLIRDPVLRAIGFELKYADSFLSFQEDRERPGLGLSEALEALEMVAEQDKQKPDFVPFAGDIDRVVSLLRQIYGLSTPPA